MSSSKQFAATMIAGAPGVLCPCMPPMLGWFGDQRNCRLMRERSERQTHARRHCVRILSELDGRFSLNGPSTPPNWSTSPTRIYGVYTGSRQFPWGASARRPEKQLGPVG